MRYDLLLLLSALFDMPEKARAVVDGLLRVELVDWDGNAFVVWSSILRETEKNGTLEDVVERVSQHYPKKRDELWAAYSRLTLEANPMAAPVVSAKPADIGIDTFITGPSPFCPNAGMHPEERSYVERSCDTEIVDAAASHVFIWVQGGFQLGKTSLLNRHRAWLGQEWRTAQLDSQLLTRTNGDRFHREIFAEVRQRTGLDCNWRNLQWLLQQHKIAFLFDDLGACTKPQITDLIERFHSVAEKVPGTMRLVVAVRESPAAVLTACGIRNPKHRDSWRVVHLEMFTREEVARLAAFLPEEIARLLHERMTRIEAATHFRPSVIQLLFDRIWKAASVADRRGGDAALALIIDHCISAVKWYEWPS
jgi:hypothetical protein